MLFAGTFLETENLSPATPWQHSPTEQGCDTPELCGPQQKVAGLQWASAQRAWSRWWTGWAQGWTRWTGASQLTNVCSTTHRNAGFLVWTERLIFRRAEDSRNKVNNFSRGKRYFPSCECFSLCIAQVNSSIRCYVVFWITTCLSRHQCRTWGSQCSASSQEGVNSF